MTTSADNGPVGGARTVRDADVDAASHRASAHAPHSSPEHEPGADPSMTELVAHLGEEAKHLVRVQLELARVEATRAAAAVVFDAIKLSLAGAILGLAGLFGVIALMLGVSVLLESYWLGALVTAGLLFLVGSLFLWRVTDTLLLPKLLPVELLDRIREMRTFAGDPDPEEPAVPEETP